MAEEEHDDAVLHDTHPKRRRIEREDGGGDAVVRMPAVASPANAAAFTFEAAEAGGENTATGMGNGDAVAENSAMPVFRMGQDQLVFKELAKQERRARRRKC